MNKTLLTGIVLCAAVSLPALAQAASGFATANVNVRSGPSTAYPAVTLIAVGQPLRINGCLAETPWCDVSFAGGRGWVAGRYIQATYQQRRIYVGPEYYRPLGIPTIGFNLDSYWDRNYRGREFYRDRDRWSRGPDWGRNGDDNWGRRPPPPPPAYDQRDYGYDAPPPPPRYRQQYDGGRQFNRDQYDGGRQFNREQYDGGRQFNGNPPPPGGFGDNNPPRPPRQPQADQGQAPRPQPNVAPQPNMAPPPPSAPQGDGPNQACLNPTRDCNPNMPHASHN